MPGKVYLLGAGPGDTELLTIKATRALVLADVILLDDLVNREILRYARGDARVIRVGKRGGCRSTPQAFTNRQMIAAARAGRIVARVKGGDPFVFGRGGEELQALQAAGIEVEVVPGITAGTAVPASIGIPVTHRSYASGVTFITGHTKDGAEPNWRALAQSGTTLVIYMGLARLAQITAALLGAGLPAATPAAAIQNGTLPQERSVVTSLSGLAQAVQRADLGSPAILVIGEVVDLAQIASSGAWRAA